MSLSVAEPQVGGNSQALDEQLIEIDSHIADVTDEIEAVRSKEQAVPLQRGCALFGIFFLAILVIAFFMTLGIDYFGKWPFYVSMAVVLALGLMRIRQRLATLDEIDRLRTFRARLEDDLRILSVERSRLQGMRDGSASDGEPSLDDNGN